MKFCSIGTLSSSESKESGQNQMHKNEKITLNFLKDFQFVAAFIFKAPKNQNIYRHWSFRHITCTNIEIHTDKVALSNSQAV